MPARRPKVGPLTEEALQAFIGRSDAPMMLSDDEQRYRAVNDAACALFGRPRGEILAMRIGDLTPDGHRADVDARTEAFRRDGTLSGRITVAHQDDGPLEVDFGSIANVAPGLHLSILAPVDGELAAIDADDARSGAGDPLTRRERQVLTALALGRTGAEIAADLYISPETVRNHVRNARAKLGARTRAQAVAQAVQSGQIELS